MALVPGTKIGPYDVLALLGRGGMGEVYRARDPRLQREVAIKTSHERFGERFDREARAIAALNHPHICQIYDVGPDYLVMELVEGDAPAGPLPVDEVLVLAEQIAAALDAAHAKGITHRDLKPGNIRVTPAGVVKVLDFGLAKFGGTSPTVPTDESPTISLAATQAGVILGTAAYMAPEQARGKPVDQRADVWAFGVVLYELLTGERLFKGEDLTETLASVVKDTPDLSRIPRRIRRVLAACLVKDPAKRLQSAGDYRHLIEPDEVAAASSSPSARTTRWRLAAAALLAIVTGVGGWFAARTTTQAPADPGQVRALLAVDPFDMRPPAAPGETRAPLPRPDRTAIALSPDGRTLVFRGATGPAASDAKLYRRPLDSLEATPIDGTEGAETVFFSPDGQWIGFATATEITKVPVNGGPASRIARLPRVEIDARANGVSWSEDDSVVFGNRRSGVWRVPSDGGEPTRVTTPGRDEYAHLLPWLLPGGRMVLFTRQLQPFEWEGAQVVLHDIASNADTVLLDDASDARYSGFGHLLFMRRGTLMAVPFDAERGVLTGGATALADDVLHSVYGNFGSDDSGAGQYAFAAGGALVYATGGVVMDAPRAIYTVSRSGNSTRLLPLPEDEYLWPRLSPDGRRIAVSTRGVERRTWLIEIGKDGRTPLTPVSERATSPVWSPDGQRIALASPGMAGQDSVPRVRRSDGSGDLLPMASNGLGGRPVDWSPDGAWIVSVDGTDLWLVDARDPDVAPRPWLSLPAKPRVRYPAFSPDGRWLAYTSNESGREEVYVQPFPGPGGRVRLSSEGGLAPTWRGDGRELYYYVPRPGTIDPARMMAVPIRTEAAGLVAGIPSPLFEVTHNYVGGTPGRSYDVTKDGQTFVVIEQLPPPPQPASNLVLVTNVLDELRRRVPTP